MVGLLLTFAEAEYLYEVFGRYAPEAGALSHEHGTIQDKLDKCFNGPDHNPVPSYQRYLAQKRKWEEQDRKLRRKR